MPLVVNETEEVLAEMCEILLCLANKSVSKNDHKTMAELLHVSAVLKKYGVSAPLSEKREAQADDYVPETVIKNTPEYRALRAKFVACLSTIADMGNRNVKKAKSPFYAGINEGLRRAAKIAIMFLDDFNENGPESMASVTTATRQQNNFVR